MEFHDAQKYLLRSSHDIADIFQKIPGSAIIIRYIKSSYQDDPVRSAIELILVIFFIRYLMAPSYNTHNGNFVELTEEVWFFVSVLNTQLSNLRSWEDNRRLTILLMSGSQSLSLLARRHSRRLNRRSSL